jgi:hypothetical protein
LPEVFFQIKNSNNLFQFIISHLKKMSICFIWLRAMLGDDNFTGGSVNLMFSLYMFYDLFQPCNTNWNSCSFAHWFHPPILKCVITSNK